MEWYDHNVGALSRDVKLHIQGEHNAGSYRSVCANTILSLIVTVNDHPLNVPHINGIHHV